MLNKSDKIYIAGHNGMAGSAIERKLKSEGFFNILKISSSELDLRNQEKVYKFFEIEKPNIVILAAAKVGGIQANNLYRAEFIYDNIMIEANIVHASYLNKVKKLLFLASSCIYPKIAPQPLKEEYLLSGYLESTNQPYAIAKIAGIELCKSYSAQYGCNYISVMPTNLYGTNDNYHPENSHVMASLLRKFFLAKKNNQDEVIIWGTGSPRREFLHVDDLADACFFLLNNYSDKEIINIGCGKDISIKELAITISEIIGFKGRLVFDPSKPDGTPRKLMDVSKLANMGWAASIDIKDGISKTLNELALIYK